MKEKTIFPREEKSEVLFDKILNDPWAYNKLFQTFCNNLFCNDDSEAILSPLQFTEAYLYRRSNYGILLSISVEAVWNKK